MDSTVFIYIIFCLSWTDKSAVCVATLKSGSCVFFRYNPDVNTWYPRLSGKLWYLQHKWVGDTIVYHQTSENIGMQEEICLSENILLYNIGENESSNDSHNFEFEQFSVYKKILQHLKFQRYLWRISINDWHGSINSLGPSDAIWWQIWVNIGSGNGLLPYGTKPLLEPMLTDHQWSPVTFILGQFHKRCLKRTAITKIRLKMTYIKSH